MVMESQFTAREVARLANVTVRSVNKAVEDKIVIRIKANGSKRFALPVHAVPYVAVVDRLDVSLTLEKKRKLFKIFGARRIEEMTSTPVEIAPSVTVDVAQLVGTDLGERAEAYARAKERLIERNPDILGGTPVIRGTRMSVYAVLCRVDDGNTVEAILNDYPALDRDMVETAVIYARSNPMVGRPGGRPWEKHR